MGVAGTKNLATPRNRKASVRVQAPGNGLATTRGDDMLDMDMMSANVAYCYERARRCAEQAREARDKVTKADLLDLQARWFSLAQLYLFDE